MKDSKLKKLHKEIEVKDQVIGGLLKVIADNKFQLPDYLMKVIEGLYANRIKGDVNGNTESDPA